MKRITNNAGQKNVRTINNVCKKGFSNDKVLAYKRLSAVGVEEWARLRRISSDKVGWVSIIGGATYQPAFVADTYRISLTVAANTRRVYEFKNLKEFLDKKDLV